MIIAERKPIRELLAMLEGHERVLIAGCNGCVTVCNAGGSKEVAIMAAALRIARKKQGSPIEIGEITLDRQCEPEFISWLEEPIREKKYTAVLSAACSIGPQYIAAQFDDLVVFPALNTGFMGGTEEHGVWAEFCRGCGDCRIHDFGGLCPITRCSKGLLHGPCSGSVDGKCEVRPEADCVWRLIYERMKKIGQLDMLKAIKPVQDWSTYWSGGVRRVQREDLSYEITKKLQRAS